MTVEVSFRLLLIPPVCSRLSSLLHRLKILKEFTLAWGLIKPHTCIVSGRAESC